MKIKVIGNGSKSTPGTNEFDRRQAVALVIVARIAGSFQSDRWVKGSKIVAGELASAKSGPA